MSLFRKNPKIQSRVVAVVGMHRSGTSCLAGSLQQKGLFLGVVPEYNEHNRKGNRENKLVAELNESILDYSGGSWYEPPARLKWSRKHEKRRNTIIEAFEGESVPVWGFKEPRSLLTMPFWQKAINSIEFVGTFRHPYLVALSLERRDSMPIEYATKLWESYNTRMLELHDENPFPIISFDLEPEPYLEQVDHVAKLLQLPSADSGEAFLEESLKNTLTDIPAGAVSKDAIAMYERLQSLSLCL
jgi:hypothetical protein